MRRRGYLAVAVVVLLLVPGCFFGWEWGSECDPAGGAECTPGEISPDKRRACVKCRWVDGCAKVECGFGNEGTFCGICKKANHFCTAAGKCENACEGKNCGPSGRGGSCGKCARADHYCSVTGSCTLPTPSANDVFAKPGAFMMGSPSGEAGRNSNETRHGVTLTQGFYMWRHEVTQEEFESLMGYSPSHFSSCGKDCPVENVSWHEAVAFCNTLSKREGLTECFDCRGSRSAVTCSLKSAFTGNGGKDYYKCPGYRLPTEAEWEYAARAGSAGATYGGLDEIAWHDGNSERKPHAVGGKKANAWGLYDMIGNVWEWTFDWYGSFPRGSTTDPVGPPSGSNRVFRGGGWYNFAGYCRAAIRVGDRPSFRGNYLGFRPSRSGP